MAIVIDEYIESKEWKTPKDVATNFTTIIRDIERRSGSRISPAKPSEINTKLAAEIPDETIVKTRLNIINRNKESIIRTMEMEDLNVNNLVDIKYKLLADSEDVSDVVNRNLNIKNYYNFLSNPSINVDTFKFNLELMQGGLPKDRVIFNNFIKDILVEFSKDRTFMATAKIDSIRESLFSGVAWKYADLSLHSIGTFDDLVRFTMILLRDEGKPLVVSSEPSLSAYFRKIFEPYFQLPADLNSFINSININPFSPSYYQYCYLTSFNQPLKFVSSKSVPIAQGTTMKHILDGIDNIAKFATTDIEQIGEIFEGLVVELYMLFHHMMQQWKQIAERFDVYQRENYSNKYEYVNGRIQENINAFDRIIKTALAKYFMLKDTTNYGFMEGNTEKSPKETLLDPIRRLINGYENIGDINKLRKDFFPIKITITTTVPPKNIINDRNILDAIAFFKDNIIYKIDKDLIDNAPIYFGGFILEDFTARSSIRILHDYFSKISTLKQRNILMINKIEDYMKTSLHMKYITNILEQMKNEIEKIKGATTTSGEKIAKTMVDTLGDLYDSLKKDEMQNLLDWNELLRSYKDMPDAYNRKSSDVLKRRETIITKVYYDKHSAQLIKLVFTKMYDRIKATAMPISSRANFSEEYKTWMFKKFADIDNKVINELKTKTTNTEVISSFEKNRGLEFTEKATSEELSEGEVSLSLSIKPITGGLRSLIQWRKLWSDITSKLGGYNIYIPYYKSAFGSVFTGGKYGLFNWTDAGRDVIKESAIFYLTNTVIPGSALDRPFVGTTLKQKLIGNGYVLVANNNAELDKPEKWRCIEYEEIKKLKAIDVSSVGGMEIYFTSLFNMIAGKDTYQDRAKYIMEDSAFRKKLVEICQSSIKKSLKECNMLISRNKIADKLSDLPDLTIS